MSPQAARPTTARFFLPMTARNWIAALLATAALLPAEEWKPVPGHLLTRWSAAVDPQNPLPEYPRPQLQRPTWTNLNGLWDYAILPLEAEAPLAFDGKILVPYPVESALSGVKKPLRKDQRLWYRRSFQAPAAPPGQRLLLHFGAVDWEARVSLNGHLCGSHRGGYDAFTFDITDAVKPGADNALVVSVRDATGEGQATGKQNFNKIAKPGGIAYSPSSGIWQTPWLESVPPVHIADLHFIPDLPRSGLRLTVQSSTPHAPSEVEITAFDGTREVARLRGPSDRELFLPIPQPHLWTPSDPFLYTLQLRLGPDEVRSYFGLRHIALGKDPQGFTSMLLNGQPLFQAGPLDQGFWPDGLHTAPTDDALRWDIEQMKRLGFNMVRKHIKIEPSRWFYWCDKLGLLVWQDMPSGGAGQGGDREKEGTPVSPELTRQFEEELHLMVQQHRNHPSVIMWVIFNEAWGQYDTRRLTQEVKAWDPSRLVNSSSGWADQGTGDLNDWHNYPTPVCPKPEPNRAAVLGEFGGIGLPTPDHTWVESAWGYRGVTGTRSLTRKYAELWRQVHALRSQGLNAAVYTQLTDVETEGNGLFTYDREILKVDPAVALQAHRGLFDPPTTFQVVAPTAEQEPTLWRFTSTPPAPDWQQPHFDDSAWSQGPAGFGAPDFKGATARTPWTSDELWLRRSLALPVGALHFPALRILRGQEIEVYLGGTLAMQLKGSDSAYDEFDILPAAAAQLRAGQTCTLAIHCRRGKSPPFIDAGLMQERRP